MAFSKGTLPRFSQTIHKIISKDSHSYTLDNDKKFQYYYLQKVSHNETFTPPIITPTPTREELHKVQKQNRILRHEGVDISTVEKEKKSSKTEGTV